MRHAAPRSAFPHSGTPYVSRTKEEVAFGQQGLFLERRRILQCLNGLLCEIANILGFDFNGLFLPDLFIQRAGWRCSANRWAFRFVGCRSYTARNASKIPASDSSEIWFGMLVLKCLCAELA